MTIDQLYIKVVVISAQSYFYSNQDKKLNLATDVKKNKGQANQVDVLLDIFENKKNGFFIEAGAHDGEYLSNTLYLEVRK